MLSLALQGPSVSAGLQMLAGAAKPPIVPDVAFSETVNQGLLSTTGKDLYIILIKLH